MAELPDDDPSLVDDPVEPIPYVFNCDVNVVKKGGGSDLAVVVVSPLQADQRSVVRLMKKLEMYLRFVSSSEFRKESGAPTVDNTRIVIHLHPESAAEVRDLLWRCHDWIRANHATLEVSDLDLPG
ncbi:MAG: hypothetical protein OEV90_13180 [Gammaproteobacteria bacterium]|nr:hypothetical protein [Gammaproteobacteria bacterium]